MARGSRYAPLFVLVIGISGLSKHGSPRRKTPCLRRKRVPRAAGGGAGRAARIALRLGATCGSRCGAECVSIKFSKNKCAAFVHLRVSTMQRCFIGGDQSAAKTEQLKRTSQEGKLFSKHKTCEDALCVFRLFSWYSVKPSRETR